MPTSYSQTATERKANSGIAAGKGTAHDLKTLLVSTVEFAATTAVTNTVKFGKIPSNARIAGCSRVYWDDLATTGSPTLDIGLGAVNGNVTDDPDALNDGLDVAAVSTTDVGSRVVKDIANLGLPAWDYVNGVTSDPGGELEVYGSIVDAGTTVTATISIELYGYID